MFQFNFARRANWIRPSQITALLALTFLGLQSTALSAQAMTRQTAIQIAMASAVPLPRSSGNHLQDGVHFFGEASQREQLGSTYMIFEVKDSKVLGAVFAPHSSYSCFEGRFNDDQLALRVEDAYDGSIYTHEIAMEETAIVASSNLQSVEMQLGLEGMHPLSNIQDQETNMLATCQAEL